MLCEDALLFQYWDVKLHTGLLMHSGNLSPLLRLLATKLSEDLVTGEGKSDSFIFSFSLLTVTPFSDSVPLCFLSFPSLYVSGVPLRGVSLPTVPWQGIRWGGLHSLTGDIYQETLPGMPTLLASPWTNRQLDSWSAFQTKRKETILSHRWWNPTYSHILINSLCPDFLILTQRNTSLP